MSYPRATIGRCDTIGSKRSPASGRPTTTTPAGGCVDVEALTAAGAVEIRVTDTGPGIPQDKLATIFEPFYSTKQPGQGTGLGLAISKELVEKQGGTLSARNRPEGGAEFVVRIPTQWTAGRRGDAAGNAQGPKEGA